MGSYGDAWDRAGQDGDEDFDPPTGSYRVRVTQADVFAGRDGREWCKVLYRILDGEHAGAVFQDFGAAGDHNPVGFRITREKLLMLGLPHDLKVTSVEELDAAADMLVGVTADVGVGHKDGYRNLTIRSSQTAHGDLAPVEPVAPSAPDDDDVPF